ncbi:MAG: hypothetical protein ACLP2F_04580 [Steroidobacteraceae bacterium]
MTELAISIAVNIVLGVVLLALLYWKRTGDAVRLAGAGEAMDLFAMHFPGAVGEATVAADHRSALIDLQRGSGVGLLQRQGRRWNARTLAPGEVSSVEADSDGTIELRFADFGWPRAQLRIADANARALWLERLNSLKEQRSSRHPGLRHA